MDVQISADEMIEELMKRITQLSMEMAAKDIIIRKLTENQTTQGVTTDG